MVNRSVALNMSYIGIDKDDTFDHNPPKIRCKEQTQFQIKKNTADSQMW